MADVQHTGLQGEQMAHYLMSASLSSQLLHALGMPISCVLVQMSTITDLSSQRWRHQDLIRTRMQGWRRCKISEVTNAEVVVQCACLDRSSST